MAKKASLLIPLAVVAAGALFFYPRKAKAAEKEEEPEVGPLGSLPIVWEDGGWNLSGGFEDALDAKLAAMYPDGPTPYDSLEISWAVLGDEVPAYLGYPSAPRAPDGSDWQADVPGAPNHFEGEESVLGLIHHVAKQVSF